MRDRIAVLYHANCPDGFTAAYVAYKYFGRENNLVDYIPVNYGEGIPELDERTEKVYILDFSFSQEEMNELYRRYDSDMHYGLTNITLLDHHKTAKETLDGWFGCTIDMYESGASLAWWHFFGYESRMPQLISYVKDRDLWRWMEYRSRDVSAFISSYDFSFGIWEMLEEQIENNINDVIGQGFAILRTKNKDVERIVKNNAHFIDIGGYSVMAVNSSLYQSEIGEKILFEYPDTPFSAIYYTDGKWDNFSLRSRRGNFDVSEIAKQYGGGGHAQASGFRQETKW